MVPARAAVVGAVLAAAAWPAAAAQTDGWVVGAGAEPTALDLVGRTVAVLWTVFLLAMGRRFDRIAVGSFLLGLCTAACWGLLADVSYALALGAAFAAYAVGMLFYAFVPRLVMAASCAWPPAALYVAGVVMTGSFAVQRWWVVVLLVSGAAVGAVFPRFGVALLSAATGTLLLTLLSPWELPFWVVAAVGLASLAWQAVGIPIAFPPPLGFLAPADLSLQARRRRWLEASRAGLTVLLAAAVLGSSLAPRSEPETPEARARMEALTKSGALDRPGLLLSPEDSRYLVGRPLRVSLVGGSGTPWDRLAIVFLGRSPSRPVHRLRAVKEPAEIERMRRAAAITSRAFATAAPLIRPGAEEAEVERAILDSYRRDGATGLAFPCIVGSGANATFPHYMANDTVMKEGFVVLDIGCSVDGYASDMTRTFPVSGRYTPAQRKLLELLVKAGDAARAKLKAGVAYADLESAARDVIRKGGFGPYFTHGLGHPVGLDVHDVSPEGGVGGFQVLAGMVITIEPGVYVPAGAPVDRAYWNLGARIEDSYLVTERGYEELTDYPKIPPERAAP